MQGEERVAHSTAKLEASRLSKVVHAYPPR